MPADSSYTDAPAPDDRANSYKALRFLVIDDQKISRQTLRMSVQSMGGFHVDMAPSHGEAMGRIRARMPDVIICDYLLGGSRNGQYLLEKLRRSQALPDRVIFIMVTAEQSYAQVIAAVELVPDDYIIKPFAPEVLRLRLEKAIQRKLAFARFYAFKEANEYAAGLAELDTMLARPDCSNLRYEILRYRTDVLAAAEQNEDTFAAYRSILAEPPFPWARARTGAFRAPTVPDHQPTVVHRRQRNRRGPRRPALCRSGTRRPHRRTHPGRRGCPPGLP